MRHRTGPTIGDGRAPTMRPAGALVAAEVARRRLDADRRRRRARASAAIASRIASRCGAEPRPGADDREVDAPRRRARRGEARRRPSRAARRWRCPAASAAPAGNSRPRSPSPAAPSSASATAWSATSPSEWPCSRGAPAISTPPRHSGSPGPERMAVRAPIPARPRAARVAGAERERRPGARSAGTVTLRLVGSPGTAWTGMLQASSSAASSVQLGPPAGSARTPPEQLAPGALRRLGRGRASERSTVSATTSPSSA